ncbi:MAG: hypothetical protein KY445_09660 [Armatimonadetes bacterium]|nr:hypothetical protein [Armatimonadota bacterium]
MPTTPTTDNPRGIVDFRQNEASVPNGVNAVKNEISRDLTNFAPVASPTFTGTPNLPVARIPDAAAPTTTTNKLYSLATGILTWAGKRVALIATALDNSQVVETDASGNLVSAAKGTAYNKSFGTTVGTVAEGNHGHSSISGGGGNVSVDAASAKTNKPFLLQRDSSTGVLRDAARVDAVVTNAADASFASDLVLSSVYAGGALSERLRTTQTGISVTNPSTVGDDSHTPLIQGYRATDKYLHIGRNGAYFARDSVIIGSFDANNTQKVYLRLHADRIETDNKPIWINGALRLFSSDRSQNREFLLSNAGTFTLAGGLTAGAFGFRAPSWSQNSRLIDFENPGGGLRSYVAGYGNIVINMDNPNGGAGWDATIPFDVNHNPTTALTAHLARFTVGGVQRFAIGADGNPIMKDTATGTLYRLKVTNGALVTEAI